MTAERAALLGCDHPLFTVVDQHTSASGVVSMAICAGGIPDRRFFATKGDPTVPNEDACCFVDDGRHLLLAVADAHFGHQSSHAFIAALAAAEAPQDPCGLAALLLELDRLPACTKEDSSSTLTIAVVDRATRQAHAVVFGDSSLVLVEGGTARRAIPRGRRFVAPGGALGEPEGRLDWSFGPGDFLVLHSDGVDEAFGREAGIGPDAIAELARSAREDAAALARQIAEAALGRCDGSVEGGRDNIAVVVARL